MDTVWSNVGRPQEKERKVQVDEFGRVVDQSRQKVLLLLLYYSQA